jgi:hypothetical protein
VRVSGGIPAGSLTVKPIWISFHDDLYLATEKPAPKDVDLLIAVTDAADLTPMAHAARRLKGHAQSYNHGADVFVADPSEHYLGRLCPWKQCAPWIRASCDALHCGRRPFLHDDLTTIQLAPASAASR